MFWKLPSNREAASKSSVSRRKFLTLAPSAAAGVSLAGAALADSLADVQGRGLGAPLGEHSERSQYAKISRIPEAGPGLRHVDPFNAINSKTPLDKLVGAITPTDVHYERSHAGVPDIDPSRHRLLLHGLVERPLVLRVSDLQAMPAEEAAQVGQVDQQAGIRLPTDRLQQGR